MYPAFSAHVCMHACMHVFLCVYVQYDICSASCTMFRIIEKDEDTDVHRMCASICELTWLADVYLSTVELKFRCGHAGWNMGFLSRLVSPEPPGQGEVD